MSGTIAALVPKAEVASVPRRVQLLSSPAMAELAVVFGLAGHGHSCGTDPSTASASSVCARGVTIVSLVHTESGAGTSLFFGDKARAGG